MPSRLSGQPSVLRCPSDIPPLAINLRLHHITVEQSFNRMPASHSTRRLLPPPPRHAEPASSRYGETFKVLGDPNRLRIVIAVSRAELCTLDIAQALGMTNPPSRTSYASSSTAADPPAKRGQTVLTSLDDEHIEDLLRIARRHSTEAM